MTNTATDKSALADTLVERAIAAQCRGETDEAGRLYLQVLGMHADHPAACHYLGILRFQQGQTEAGLKLVRHSLQLAPGDAGWHNDHGNMLAGIGADDEAASAFRTALSLHAEDPQVWNNLGAVLLRSGHPTDALETFDTALRLRPDDESALNNRGHALSQLGRAVEAARSFSEAFIRSSGDKSPQMLATAYYILGRVDDAATVYRDWLAREPDNPVARHMLAASTGAQGEARATDAYLEAYFDHMADIFDSKMTDTLAYRVPELMAGTLQRAGTPPHSLVVLDAGCGTGLSGRQLRPFARHLTGIDLSEKSLQEAGGKACYDALHKAEIIDYLERHPGEADLVTAADTLIYFGALEALLAAIRTGLRPEGRLIASVELLDDPDRPHAITPSGRYCHQQDYVVRALLEAGFDPETQENVILRTELGQPVRGLLVTARKTG